MENKLQTSNQFKKSFFRNVLVSGGYNYLSQALTFLGSIIIARLLSPSNYGLVGLITVFTGFISVFSDSGISLAVIKSDYRSIYHRSLDTIAMYMGFGLFILTSLLAYPIAHFYNDSSLLFPCIALASTFIFRSMSIVRGALLSKALNFNFLGKTVLYSNVLAIFLTIILGYIGFQHWAIIIPQIISSIAIFIMYELKLRFGFNISPIVNVKVAYRYTKKTIGSLIGFNLVNYWARNTDNLIVGKVYGTIDLGIYNRAYSLLTLPLSLITGLMGTVLYPSLKKLKSEGGEIYPEYIFILRIVQFIVYPITFIFILFPNELVLFLWGSEWIKVGTLLPYFGILVFSQSLLSTSGNLLVLQGKENVLMLSGWIGAFFMISGIIYGSTYSVLGIAQFYCLSYVSLVLPFNMIFVYRKGLDFPLKPILSFWIPIIIISVGIWISCFLNLYVGKLTLLLMLLMNMIFSSRKELFKLYINGKSKLARLNHKK